MQPHNEHGRTAVPGDTGWRCRSWGRGMLCCSTRYKAEETIKRTVTNDLGKSREVCFRAWLPFRVLNPGDRDRAGKSS